MVGKRVVINQVFVELDDGRGAGSADTHQRAAASCPPRRRLFSVGFYYLELFRATLNYVYFLRETFDAS